MAYDASASDVAAALNALTTPEGVVVEGNYTDGFTVTFRGDDWQDFTNHPELTSNDGSLTGATISHATTQNGSNAGTVIELSKFVRTDYIVGSNNNRQDFIVAGASDVIAGLFFRTYYNSTGGTNVKFKTVHYFHET